MKRGLEVKSLIFIINY